MLLCRICVTNCGLPWEWTGGKNPVQWERNQRLSWLRKMCLLDSFTIPSTSLLCVQRVVYGSLLLPSASSYLSATVTLQVAWDKACLPIQAMRVASSQTWASCTSSVPAFREIAALDWCSYGSRHLTHCEKRPIVSRESSSYERSKVFQSLMPMSSVTPRLCLPNRLRARIKPIPR